MIVGNGLLGSAFKNSTIDFDDCLIFASGVSNSKNIYESDFKRERNLLVNHILDHDNLKFIYFSSMLADISYKPYYEHKLKMERIIEKMSDNYIIFRLPQVIGKTGNPANLVNHIINSIKNGDELTIFKNIERAIIDIDDIVNIIGYVIPTVTNSIIDISNIEKINIVNLCANIAYYLDKPITMKLSQFDYIIEHWTTGNSPIIDKAIKK